MNIMKMIEIGCASKFFAKHLVDKDSSKRGYVLYQFDRAVLSGSKKNGDTYSVGISTELHLSELQPSPVGVELC